MSLQREAEASVTLDGETQSEPESWADQYEAPEGKVWICQACGKRAKNRANGEMNPGGDYGWDESCFLNAILVDAGTLRPEAA